MFKQFHGLELEIVEGDITSQPDIDVIVNAANAQLTRGGGVAGAIHRAAGPELEIECLPLGPINPGQAVITKAYCLPNKRVIHCLGPVYGQDEPSGELLANCYRNALRLADENNLESIAFPAISTGIFGYPVCEAALVALKSVLESMPQLRNIHRVRFVLFDPDSRSCHEQTLLRILSLGK